MNLLVVHRPESVEVKDLLVPVRYLGHFSVGLVSDNVINETELRVIAVHERLLANIRLTVRCASYKRGFTGCTFV